MKHLSVPLGEPIEFVEMDPLKTSPLISKCKIKVCYVGEKPNRNGSIITREVAQDMAQSLPGAIIAGYYNKKDEDFEQHNREIDTSDGTFKIKDTTRPYGFVSMDAKPWFEWFEDDGVPHEYLMVEGYLWTGEYPECQRVVDKGNNQSMELSEKHLKANWSKDDNGNPQFFIINEAIISKLCILGENFEPCFEGASIGKTEFAFEEGFKKELLSFMKMMQENLKEGGAPVNKKYSVNIGDALWTELYNNFDYETYALDGVFEEGDQKFAVLRNRTDNSYNRMNFSFDNDIFTKMDELTALESYAEETHFNAADVEAFELEFKKKKEDDKEDNKPPFLKKKEDGSDDKSEDKKESKPGEKEDSKPGDKKDESEDDSEDDEEKKKKKKKYNLEEVEEYAELQEKYNELNTKFAALENTNKDLMKQVEELTQFKLSVDRVAKEDLINNQFFMLEAEDKKDVIENIDNYSLDDIEAKLAVIAVRKKVNFSLDDNHADGKNTTFNLDSVNDNEELVPAWIKAVKATAKSMNE